MHSLPTYWSETNHSDNAEKICWRTMWCGSQDRERSDWSTADRESFIQYRLWIIKICEECGQVLENLKLSYNYLTIWYTLWNNVITLCDCYYIYSHVVIQATTREHQSSTSSSLWFHPTWTWEHAPTPTSRPRMHVVQMACSCHKPGIPTNWQQETPSLMSWRACTKCQSGTNTTLYHPQENALVSSASSIVSNLEY